MKYTTIFSSTIKPLVSEEKDKYLAMASLLEVADFVPDLDTEKNIDLLPIAFNACVVNRVNKNGDVIDTSTASEILESFINKPINIEHNRQRVLGTILTAGYSEFGTDKLLTEEQAKSTKGPFNITLGGVVWRIVNSDLADLIEDSSDPTSESYQKISASWELGFSGFDLIILEGEEKNIENGTVITDPDEKEALESHLRSEGGTGELEERGRFVYRKVSKQVVPLGIGLTESPAADVKGIAVKEEKEEKEYVLKSSESEPKQTESTSLSKDKNVNRTKDVVMKITSLKDINDESLKTLEASVVHDFIQEEIRNESEKFTVDKAEKENALKETKEQLDSLSEDHDKVKEELEKVNTNLKTLETEKAAKEAVELFNQRMASFDEEYELEDEDRKVIASDVKELDEDSYSNYWEKMSILLKAKNKTVLAKQEKETEAAKKEEVTETTKASDEAKKPEAKEEAETEEVVDEALSNAEVESDSVAATTEADESTVYEKYKEAFSLDNFEIK
jgi:hypothetical protein